MTTQLGANTGVKNGGEHFGKERAVDAKRRRAELAEEEGCEQMYRESTDS